MSSSNASHFLSPNIQIQPRRRSSNRRIHTISRCDLRRREVFVGLSGLFFGFSSGSFSPLKSSAVDVNPTEQKDKIMDSTTPVVLDTAVSTTVRRPRKSRSKQEKEDEEEVVVIEGINFNRSEFVKFDVYVNSPDYDLTPSSSEFAGSFVSVPHVAAQSGMKTSLTLGLTDLLEDIKADDDDEIVVTLVPRKGKVEIGGVYVRYLGDDYS